MGIQINLLRISSDSKYLEFDIECPIGYTFNKLYIYHYVLNGTYDTKIDASNLLIGETQNETIRIDTNILGTLNTNNIVTMYKVEFGVIAENQQDNPELENVIGYCSNVNFVYENLLDLILKTNGCTSYDNFMLLSRNYMFLYAHLEAMRLQRYEDAEKFYDIVYNLFTNCGANSVRNAGIYNKSCGCK